MPGAVPVRVGRLVGVPSVVRRLVPAVFVLVMLAAGAAAASPSATAAATSRAFPIETLGDRGADVRAIQGLLAHHGFAVPIDGVFGASTRTAVRAFQAARGLPVDGLVRETTWVEARRRARAGQQGAGGQGLPAPAQREALRPPGRRRRLRHGDARRGHHLPEAHGHDRERPGRTGHLADPAVAFRLPGLQRDEPVRLQRRERHGQLGDRRPRSVISRPRPLRSRRPVTGGSRSATSAASTVATSPCTRRTRSASTSTSARSATRGTSAPGARTGASPRTTAPRPGRSSRRSGPRRAATSS